MVKNAQGEWEYRFVMERAKEFYKFYDPALEGDIAYFEDPEMPESVANPFGSKNGVVRRPKAGGAGAAAAAEAEEEYPKLNFGMWSRNTYNMWFGSNLSRKVAYDKDGKVAKEGKVFIAGGTEETVKDDNQNMAVVDQNLSHRWEGENGTTAGNATRVWLDKTRFRSSSTFKVHGMVFKHMQLDAEINFNFNVETNYSSYWKASDKTAREDAMNEIYEQLDELNLVKIGKVNVDEDDDLAAAFGISSIPALFLVKDGKVVKKSLGYQGLEALKEFVK